MGRFVRTAALFALLGSLASCGFGLDSVSRKEQRRNHGADAAESSAPVDDPSLYGYWKR